MEALGFSSNEFEVKDLLDASTMTWSPHTYVSLNPHVLLEKSPISFR
jgi:hypothetical protein